MRIGVDLRSLENGSQHRGIGRFATELITALGAIDHTNEYVFFVSSPKAIPPEFDLPGEFKHSHAAGRGEGLRAVKYIRILYLTPRPLPVDKYHLDVFFHLDLNQPIRATKTPIVSVVYDLIPHIYSDIYQHVHFGGYSPGRLIGYARLRLVWKIRAKWLYEYKKAARIISISEHSKKDLLRFIPGITADKVAVVPLAASKLPAKGSAATARIKQLGLKKFFFYVGGADPRKGLVSLAASMEDVWKKHPNVELVLAGKEVTDLDVPEARKLAETIKGLSKPSQVIRLGFISDEELSYLYRHAVAFVFPSRYEGFGLPVLEAMQAGCPVVCYDNSSIPEVAGNAALIAADGKDLAPSMSKLLSRADLRRDLIDRGKRQAAKFTWTKAAKATLKVLEEAKG